MDNKLFVVHAFTKDGGGGNPAGVVWLEDAAFPSEDEMQRLAAELAYSETAFIRRRIGKHNPASQEASGADGAEAAAFETRYFTPVAEVDLCGHATIGAFKVLQFADAVRAGGDYTNTTKAGDLSIEILDDAVFMEAGEPMELAVIKGRDQLRELYEIMGLDVNSSVEMAPAPHTKNHQAILPAIVSTGLPDILLPVKDKATLLAIAPDFARLAELSEDYGVVGVHAFVSEPEAGGWQVRNFAPLYGIDEESATGTSNAALAYRLYRCGKIPCGEIVRFEQGESMQCASEILCRVELDGEQVRVWVGGDAIIT